MKIIRYALSTPFYLLAACGWIGVFLILYSLIEPSMVISTKTIAYYMAFLAVGHIGIIMLRYRRKDAPLTQQ
ncbi:hypothetical protein [Sphingomonas oryzagri]